MLPHERRRRLLEQLDAELGKLLNDPVELLDRLAWLGIFDLLDELKKNLLQGRGKGWLPSVRDAYVRVRTGLKEIFELLFAGAKEFPAAYVGDRLVYYRDRIRDAIFQMAQAGSAAGL